MIAADMFRYPITYRERPSTKTVVNFFFQRAHDRKGLPRG